MEAKVKHLINTGVYDQHEIFNRLYPLYKGHYSKLRDIISKVKNNDVWFR